MRRVAIVLFILLIALAGCDSALLAPDAETPLPKDQILDVLRDAEFDYSSLAPVGFSLTVNSFSGETASRALDESAPIVIQLTDQSGQVLHTSAVSDGGTASGEVFVPTTMTSMTLTIDSPVHEKRSVTVQDPYQYEEIDRVMAVHTSRGSTAGSDRDADGIDDVYDAFPDDPELAFSRSIPASDTLTIAFEDNYPDLGDGDYNDFVAEYRITEYRSAKNTLVRVDGTATAVARGAGFDHEFGIVVEFAGHKGTVSVSRFDGNQALVGTSAYSVAERARVVLFESTKHAAFTRDDGKVRMDNIAPDEPVSRGYTTTFSITYSAAKDFTPSDVWAPYDPYLLIDNPDLTYRPDVHLIGKAPLANSQNPIELEGFRDADGYPRALLVPNSWAAPTERTHIENAYPDFLGWRESLGATNPDWYFTPVDAYVVNFAP